MTISFNPLDKRAIANSIADALLRTPAQPFDSVSTIAGAGVYAIYYCGDFPPYKPISDMNRGGRSRPVYVGKAIPRGGRKGLLREAAGSGTALRDRLRHHESSIDQAENLAVNDFAFRALICDDVWIPLGESILIDRFRPVWNVLIDGFGNNDPGTARATTARSSWDVLHPGRKVMEKLTAPGIAAEILVTKIEAYLAPMVM